MTTTTKPSRPTKKNTSKKAEQVTTPETMFVSDSAAKRAQFRNEILNAQVERDIRPIDLEIVRNACLEDYKDNFDNAARTGTVETVRCRITYDLIRGLIMANGANRGRTISHCEGLATDFRGLDSNGEPAKDMGFESAMTHIVLSPGGLMLDGGHSTFAIALAFFGTHIFKDIYTRQVSFKDDASGEMVSETCDMHLEEGVSKNFALNLDYDEQGKPIYSDTSGDEKAQQWLDKYDDSQLVVNIVLNAPAHICRKLAERRLNIGVKEYLEMVPQLKKFMEETKIDSNTWEQVVKGWKLRTDCKENKDGSITYGTLNKGGRPNNAEAPAWLLAFAPQAHDALVVIGESFIVHGLIGSKGTRLSKKDILVAMCCLNVEGMQRLWGALSADKQNASAFAKALAPHVVNDGTNPLWAAKPAWWIVTALIAYGKGKSPEKATSIPLSVGEAETHPQQDPELRANGWDSYEYDCLVESGDQILEGEDRDDILVACGEQVSTLIGVSEELATTLKSKQARKGKGPRGPRK